MENPPRGSQPRSGSSSIYFNLKAAPVALCATLRGLCGKKSSSPANREKILTTEITKGGTEGHRVAKYFNVPPTAPASPSDPALPFLSQTETSAGQCA